METQPNPAVQSTAPVQPKQSQAVIWAIIVLLFAVGGFMLYQSNGSWNSDAYRGATLEAAHTKLPAGFPETIPVEEEGITDAYKSVYAEQGATQYTVNFDSTQPASTLWDQYLSYVSSSGYVLDEENTSSDQGVITAKSGSNLINILIYMPDGGSSKVAINYLERE